MLDVAEVASAKVTSMPLELVKSFPADKAWAFVGANRNHMGKDADDIEPQSGGRFLGDVEMSVGSGHRCFEECVLRGRDQILSSLSIAVKRFDNKS